MSKMPETEARNDSSRDLDLRSSEELVEVIVDDQEGALAAVRSARAVIAHAIERIAERIERGGSLHYVGAGTSGRLAVQDASEIPPTFGTPPQVVQAHIAGGAAAFTRAVEDAEDDGAAAAAMVEHCVRASDALIGISASGSATYVHRAVVAARAVGAYTVAIVNVSGTELGRSAEDEILLATGAEVLTGSTRLKAGTAQKIVLNAISTAVMVRLGKVYDNLMVDVVATNAKLRDRAVRLVQALTGLDASGAQVALEEAKGRVKVAAIMVKLGIDAGTASALLERERGRLRPFL